MTLSGGMKRRVLIAKALSHEPPILFLDEPTAGVDVELRARHVGAGAALRDGGVTIILTTHYIEEAEEMADRIGVIAKGELILVEEKARADAQARQEAAHPELEKPLAALPAGLDGRPLTLADGGNELGVHLRRQRPRGPASPAARRPGRAGHRFRGSARRAQSSLEDIFVNLVEASDHEPHGARAIYRFEMARSGARCCRASSRR